MPTDLPSRKPARTPGEALARSCLTALLMVPLNAWILMVLAGADHATINPAVPAFSFVQSTLVAVTLGVVGSFFYPRAGS
jgi:hypothetical protein